MNCLLHVKFLLRINIFYCAVDGLIACCESQLDLFLPWWWNQHCSSVILYFWHCRRILSKVAVLTILLSLFVSDREGARLSLHFEWNCNSSYNTHSLTWGCTTNWSSGTYEKKLLVDLLVIKTWVLLSSGFGRPSARIPNMLLNTPLYYVGKVVVIKYWTMKGYCHFDNRSCRWNVMEWEKEASECFLCVLLDPFWPFCIDWPLLVKQVWENIISADSIHLDSHRGWAWWDYLGWQKNPWGPIFNRRRHSDKKGSWRDP